MLPTLVISGMDCQPGEGLCWAGTGEDPAVPRQGVPTGWEGLSAMGRGDESIPLRLCGYPRAQGPERPLQDLFLPQIGEELPQRSLISFVINVLLQDLSTTQSMWVSVFGAFKNSNCSPLKLDLV